MRIDKMSMAHGLEVRSPFLDYQLVDRAMAIPFARKAGWRTSKPLLKDAVADLLPEVILKRQKWGWLTPVHFWLCGSLQDDAKRLVASLPATGIFSPTVCNLVENYDWPSAQKVWALVVFALWYRQYIARD
jgi:asparagine synthase (glutamine-hydrolysing)